MCYTGKYLAICIIALFTSSLNVISAAIISSVSGADIFSMISIPVFYQELS